jgi:hypothetical protein
LTCCPSLTCLSCALDPCVCVLCVYVSLPLSLSLLLALAPSFTSTHRWQTLLQAHCAAYRVVLGSDLDVTRLAGTHSHRHNREWVGGWVGVGWGGETYTHTHTHTHTHTGSEQGLRLARTTHYPGDHPCKSQPALANLSCLIRQSARRLAGQKD